MRTSVSSSGVKQELRPHPITLEGSSRRYALISVHGDPAAEIGRDGAGGQNVYVRSLGLALAKLGCQVDMFTRREHPDQPKIIQHSSGCRTIRLDAGPTKFIHRDYLFEYLPAFIEAWLAFQQESGYTYEIIHSNYWLSGWVGLQLSSRLGVPQVHTYHSIGKVKYQTMGDLPEIAQTRLATERACLEKADCVIATSPQEAEDLRRLVSENGRIEIIPCGIDTQHFSQFSREKARELLGIPAATKLLLYVGRFDRRKGIETLLQACAKLPRDFQLYLVGGKRGEGEDGIEYDRIVTAVELLNLSDVVNFKGQVPQPDLPPYYAAADVCIVPSYYEPFGLVAIEAMAAGTPVIASRVGGLQYSIADGETGLLVPPQNPDALAAVIESISDDRAKTSALGEAGRERVRSEFSRTAIATKIERLYRALLRSRVNN